MRQLVARLVDVWEVPADQVNISTISRRWSRVEPLYKVQRASGREHEAWANVLFSSPALPLYEGGGRLRGRPRERIFYNGAKNSPLLPSLSVDAAVADYTAGAVPNPTWRVSTSSLCCSGCGTSSCKTPPCCSRNSRGRCSGGLPSSKSPSWPSFAERVRAAEAVQQDPAHVAIRGVIPIVADAVSVIGNPLSVSQDWLL
jgi:hypothetical protein